MLEQCIFTISPVLGRFAVHYVVSSGFILTKIHSHLQNPGAAPKHDHYLCSLSTLLVIEIWKTRSRNYTLLKGKPHIKYTNLSKPYSCSLTMNYQSQGGWLACSCLSWCFIAVAFKTQIQKNAVNLKFC